MRLTDILEENNVKKQVDELVNLYNRLKVESNMEDFYKKEDMSSIVKSLENINNARLWNSLWSVFLILPSNEYLVMYCEKVLNEHKENFKSDIFNKRIDYFLSYLFKYVPKKRDELLKKYIYSSELILKFAAVEELANTDLVKALLIMMDIYESAIITYYHDIVDSIDLWISYEGNSEILCEIEKRINRTEDEKLKSKYVFWKQSIKSKIG